MTARLATTMSTRCGRSCRKSPCWVSGEASSSSTPPATAGPPCACSTAWIVTRRTLTSPCCGPARLSRWARLGDALLREIRSFGFEVDFQSSVKPARTRIASAFLKANTYRQLLVVDTPGDLLHGLHAGKTLKIKLEVDTDPPAGFETESRYLLQPIPFGLRVYRLPDLFAGKLHAVLCRRWKSRMKGRDWYDLVWYAARHPHVNLRHLETRMRQSGDYGDDEPLTRARLLALLRRRVQQVEVAELRKEVAPFVRQRRSLEVWSRDFFLQVIERIEASP